MGAAECVEERVALRVDLDASARVKSLAHHPTVLRKDGRVAIAQLAQELSRPLDVGEEECDRAARQLAHGSV